MNAPDASTLEDEKTRDELYAKAQELDIEGRSDMDKHELAEAVANAENASSGESTGGAEPPAPGRPAQGATNPKVAGPPPVADQPGLGRPANPVDIPGPEPRMGSAGVGSAVERARANAAAHREAAAQG